MEVEEGARPVARGGRRDGGVGGLGREVQTVLGGVLLFSFCSFFRRSGGKEIGEPYCDGYSGLRQEEGFVEAGPVLLRQQRSRCHSPRGRT